MSKQYFIPRKRFGQHFLHDPGVIQHIVDVIAPTRHDQIIEIGPGLGALTQHILPLVGRLEVIELDRDVIPELQANCAQLGELIIHQADALKFDFAQTTNKNTHLRLIGNLPYNISTPLIFHLIKYAHLIKDMYFMLQKEVVERMAAVPGDDAYGRLSVMVQYYCKVDYLFTVRPGAFNPPPKVDSAIVAIRPYRDLPFVAHNETLFADIVREAFNHRRKVLRNSLKPLVANEMWSQLAVSPEQRAEELSVQDYVNIANTIFSFQS
jgi:16S rRNA (adenine1518-N6/adenine1519-N6)-dimethyltransferase